MSTTFKHSWSGKEIVGRRLGVGDVIEPGDVYANSGGDWMPASSTHCVGMKIWEGYEGVEWVRLETSP